MKYQFTQKRARDIRRNLKKKGQIVAPFREWARNEYKRRASDCSPKLARIVGGG